MIATILITAPAVNPEDPAVEHPTHNGHTPVHTAVLRLSPTGLTAILGIAHCGQVLAAVRLTDAELALLLAEGVDIRRELARRQKAQTRRRQRDAKPRRACAGCGNDIGRGNVRWCPDCRVDATAAQRSTYSRRYWAKKRSALGKTVDPVRSAKIRAGHAAAKARRDAAA